MNVCKCLTSNHLPYSNEEGDNAKAVGNISSLKSKEIVKIHSQTHL